MTLRTITFDDEQWQVVPKVLPDAMLCRLLPVAGGNSHQAERIAAAMADRLALQSQWRDVLAAAPEPPAHRPMTDEEIDAATGSARDALLDHLYEYGPTSEGVQGFVRMLARAVERHHNIGKGESNEG